MELSKECAHRLLEIKAVKLSPSKPFTWASGLQSPIYCDNRKTLSYPEIRTFIKEGLVHLVRTNFPSVEVIAGVATGAIAQGVLVAQDMNLPFIYVRSEEKKHGLTNIVEGVVKPNQKVVVIEDLVSTGQSSLKAVHALQDIGCEVLGMAAIFTYVLPIARQRFEEAMIELFTLTNYNTLVQEAIAKGYIEAKEEETLIEWRKDPAAWAKNFD
ncbi:MAG: orotate phosphoribosyltransferase [Bacteroidales bacterium]|jgi:orotate phosphoribosyltransferase|nr:orotate phosphoribosyltransferase [Bacteroidales bacterium]MDD2687346.1 orotate phosphoribosyltransferase [Bacteroidales bacterium]MDD3330203.1 orotate phosphoribosyltransferase [Bacteroidales bacterium]MDD3691679.1 orotate phosphoribosyltransferase [Bacteroidales bacterium]MDD4044466.1 orotate phosphoribosyltransferase [Bacteroidales bacterium]